MLYITQEMTHDTDRNVWFLVMSCCMVYCIIHIIQYLIKIKRAKNEMNTNSINLLSCGKVNLTLKTCLGDLFITVDMISNAEPPAHVDHRLGQYSQSHIPH